MQAKLAVVVTQRINGQTRQSAGMTPCVISPARRLQMTPLLQLLLLLVVNTRTD